ncbi:MAG: glycosyl transferase [Spirochaetes bacterium RBG_16_49_21]|nr:MAG: glycosyl transferase [Spirochaetes bacterium RBG_16_49_21]
MPAVKTKRKNPRRPYISVVLPVYNEEDNIRPQYEVIIKALDPLNVSYEVIFIDDGSIDSSPDILRDIANKDRNIKLVIFRRNFGQTAAMSAGIDYASGEIILFMDSDLQNDPNDIGMLLKKMAEGYDVVSGWRKKRMDKLLSRKLPSWVANWLIAKVTGVKLHDLGCSLKAYRSSLLKQVNLYGEMHRFIPVHASWLGAKITEVPVGHHPRKFGKSKVGIIRTFKVLLDLVTVTFLGKYSTKPIYVFGGTGFLLFFLSIFSGITVLLMKITLNQSMTRNPLLLLTVMFIVLSVLFIQIGILAEILIRIYHESQGKPPYSVLETINIRRMR